MDAHLFRRVCDTLVSCLKGARLEKIQAPAPDVLCLSFYAQRRKLHLLVKYGRRNPFLCAVKERPAGLPEPSSQIMRLRKHAQGRRVSGCVVRWQQRCLTLLFSNAPNDAPACRLCLNLRSGCHLESADDPPATDFVRWPSPEELPQALREWSGWPVLTPALRRALPLLEEAERQALLADLVAGGGDVFVYGQGADLEFSAWPLPDALRAGREEQVFEDVFEALSRFGAARIFTDLALAERGKKTGPLRREARRLRRLLEKLDLEEMRLRGMADKQREALAIQAQLWRYPSDFKIRELLLHDSDAALRICPEPGYSLRAHMERLFHSAGRGRRGLAMLEQRRAELRRRLSQAEAALSLGRQTHGLPPERPAFPASARDRNRNASQGISAYGDLPANVQAFAAGDGTVVLRGRDARENHALLRLAKPYDLWMHAEGGPGAHVLVRNEQGKSIPQSVLDEAANLALAKSPQRGNAAGRVICAWARHVRPVRGGKPGSALVDKVECYIEVRIDPDMELRLTRLQG